MACLTRCRIALKPRCRGLVCRCIVPPQIGGNEIAMSLKIGPPLPIPLFPGQWLVTADWPNFKATAGLYCGWFRLRILMYSFES